MVLLHALILMLYQPYKWGSDQLGESCSSAVGNILERCSEACVQLSQADQCEASEHLEIRGKIVV